MTKSECAVLVDVLASYGSGELTNLRDALTSGQPLSLTEVESSLKQTGFALLANQLKSKLQEGIYEKYSQVVL